MSKYQNLRLIISGFSFSQISLRWTFLFLLIIPHYLFGQTYTTEQLLEAWRVEGVNQTISAERAYADLTENFDEVKFIDRLTELEAYLRDNFDKRLSARIMLYRMQGRPENVCVDEFWNSIMRTGELRDEQLLSEMYAKYGEFKAPKDEKLYYLLKALKIQEGIGNQYFKHIYYRYLTVGGILYRINDFKRSLEFGLKGLAAYQQKKNYVLDYIYLLDLVGASYRNLGQVDSAFRYYVKIKQVLGEYQIKPETFSPKKLDVYYLNVWNGIADGGKGRCLVLKGNYKDAFPLLKSNLDTALKYREFGNASSVLNVLANVNYQQKDFPSALKTFQRAYNYGLKANEYYHLRAKLETAEGLAKTFSVLKTIDSAYFYLKLFNVLQDSLQSKVNSIHYSEINTELEFELMRKHFADAKAELERQKLMRNIVLLSIFVLAMLALLLYNTKRLRYKVREEKLNKEKELAKQEVDYAQAQVRAFTNSISEKNKLIEDLQVHYEGTEATGDLILEGLSILTEDDWSNFRKNFVRVYPEFLKEVRRLMPDISSAEQRFLVLSKLRMSTKEMAVAQGITQDSVRKQRYRLRRRLESISEDLTLESFLDQN
jgi:DNA-binding CsgD family transcriptional regulator